MNETNPKKTVTAIAEWTRDILNKERIFNGI
jgi:hypothetical protein